MKSVALLEQWQEDNLASMNPFERYLYDNGLLDDRIRPEITTEDVILEPTDLVPASTVSAIGSAMGGFPIAPSKCHTNFKVTDVPYNHCSYMGCVNCPEVVSQGVVVSHCTCAHHRLVQ
jgi:hypothetical protein